MYCGQYARRKRGNFDSYGFSAGEVCVCRGEGGSVTASWYPGRKTARVSSGVQDGKSSGVQDGKSSGVQDGKSE